MPTFLATSRIVVRAKPIFWKSWSETSRIFFFVASFLVSRRPMVALMNGSVSGQRLPGQQPRAPEHERPGSQDHEAAVVARGQEQRPAGDQHQDRDSERGPGGPPSARAPAFILNMFIF